MSGMVFEWPTTRTLLFAFLSFATSAAVSLPGITMTSTPAASAVGFAVA